MDKRASKSKIIALTAVAALPVVAVVQTQRKMPPIATPVETATSQVDTPPVEPIEWSLIQLTGYDAQGNFHSMPLAMHPHTIFDLIGLPGDANVDGIVDLDDLNLVLTNMGRERD